MPATFSPSFEEWRHLEAQLYDALKRLQQAELFNAEMDKRQARAELVLDDHEKRLVALERWRASADATMVATYRSMTNLEAELPKLRAEDTAIIGRLKPLETAKPQLESAVHDLKSAVAAQARVDDLLRTDLTKQAERLVAAEAKVAALQTADSDLAERAKALELWRPKVDEANKVQDERLAKLEAPKVAEGPVEPPKEPIS